MTQPFIPLTTNIILYCSKWHGTVNFYRNRLELPVTFESDWLVEFRLTDTSHVSIADERRATIKSGQGTDITLTMQVQDADIVWRRLRAAGMAVGEVRDHAWGARVFYFRDPEGHRLEIWSKQSE